MKSKANSPGLGKRVFMFANNILPKFRQVVIKGFPNCESSAIAMANHIHTHYKLPVWFVVDHTLNDDPGNLLLPGIKRIQKFSKNKNSLLFKLTGARYRIGYLLKVMTSKYLFYTHEMFFETYPPTQVMVNIWHGLLYKNICKLLGDSGFTADVTVATSELSRSMFQQAFGVTPESIFISGYPRNDLMVKASRNKEAIKKRVNPQLSEFDKLLVWLPTYRRTALGGNRLDGTEAGNPFYIAGFNVDHFNEVLKENNSLCIVKPHPMAVKYPESTSFSNIWFIDDAWLPRHNVTLYDLVGCTDILISDVSSIITDYMLVDNPIICVSTDFDEYQKTRGFYFKDIEEWIPSEVLKDQEEFFNYLQNLLHTGLDPFAEKRLQLKSRFFKDHDDLSSARLATKVLGPAQR